jgi:hypothetical protein
MTDAPILEAEAVLATAIASALAPYVGTYNGRPKAYYQLAEQGAPLPYIVFQFQSAIGRMDWIAQAGATVLVTVKALAANAKAARDLLAAAAPGMDAIAIDGYAVTARYNQSPTVPPQNSVWQALHLYRLRLEVAP